jgi:hypothetical protein
VVPRFPGPPVRIPRTELPEFLRKKQEVDYSKTNTFYAAQAACFGVAANTLPDLERPYCDVHISEGHVKRCNRHLHRRRILAAASRRSAASIGST